MSLINATDLSKSFGPDDIFSGISLSIPQRARIGLVGPNGVGKTTLLRILANLEDASSGQISRARQLKIGYLPQNATFDSSKKLWDECLAAFSHLIKMQKKLTQMENEMADPESAETILEIYGKLQTEFDHLGGYTFENRIRQTLTGLGFARQDFQRPLAQLSGGERTRAFLGKLLLSDPDLLLLDEPTNHLDIGAIEWLESYLRDWEGATLIVSHDRYFLNQVVSTIWEMTPTLEIYRGNYNTFAEQRAARYQRRLEEYKKQQTFIEKEEDYIRRNIAGQNTRQAQGRRKRLERLLVEAQVARPLELNKRHLNLNLNRVERSGDLVLRTHDLVIGYQDDQQPLFNVPDLLLKRGECAAVIGPNGAGKTTFLKTILEEIPALAGETILGASLKIGYFAQAHEDLHLDWTLMEEIDAVAPHMLPAEVRNYLARFLFTEEDVFKQVGMLSGGERGRLALAILALQGANLLLLDEPTNHLDLSSQEVLQSVLSEFAGTILLVSHDRYLIDALSSHIWEIEIDAKFLRVFKGSYSEYRTDRLTEEADIFTESEQGKTNLKKKSVQARERKLSKHEIHRHRDRLLAVEMKIIELETKQVTIEHRLERPPQDAAEVQRLGEEHQLLLGILEELLVEWGNLSEILADNQE